MLRSVSILLAAGYLLAAGVWILSSGVVRRSSDTELINVACDPTRELWDELNPIFCARYEARTGTPVAIRNSHGGSASQAWQVKNGFEADVVTLAMWPDTDAIRKAGLMDDGWETKLDGGSLPYISTIVFVVRTGSEKTRDLRNWEDLIARDDIRIIVPNPKTSGNGKWAFLAAWGSVKRRGGSDAEAEEFVKRLFQRTNGLDPSARAATENFAKNGQGDVHLTWENEAHLEVNPSGGKLKLHGDIANDQLLAVEVQSGFEHFDALKSVAGLRNPKLRDDLAMNAVNVAGAGINLGSLSFPVVLSG